MKEVNVDKLKYGFRSRDKKQLYIKNCGAINRISDWDIFIKSLGSFKGRPEGRAAKLKRIFANRISSLWKRKVFTDGKMETFLDKHNGLLIGELKWIFIDELKQVLIAIVGCQNEIFLYKL